MSQSNNINPPKWPLKFLRFFLKKQYLEEIEGDMQEIFNDNVEQFSVKNANRIYTWEMLKLLRPALVKNLKEGTALNQFSMFRNYFKTSLRGLMKTPLTSFINIFGLAVAIGICTLVYGFATWVYRTDQFHEHKSEVYLATFVTDRDGKLQQYGKTPRPLGEMLKADFAYIEKVCRVEDKNVVIKYDDAIFQETLRFTDPEFLEMLTFPMKWGEQKSLSDISSIILSERMSIKYFGDENPVGRDILVMFDEHQSKTFKVTGVAEAFPKSHTIEFNFLVNFQNLKLSDPGYDVSDWSKIINAILIQVKNSSDIIAIGENMDTYKSLRNRSVEEDWAVSSFVFEPIATLHERAGNIKDDISRSSGDNYKSIIFLSILAALLLALACFNYINIAIVSAAKRLKEIGVRKTIGATRRVVIVQFLTENVVVTFFALVLGLMIGKFLIIPAFEFANDFSMGFKLIDINLWICLPVLLFLTAAASGIYPAVYISRFEVIKILKGSVQFGKKNPLTKVFLGFQLIIACILIANAVMFTQNSAYLEERSWGYDQEAVLYTRVPGLASFEKLNTVMTQDHNVLTISGSGDHLGKSYSTKIVRFPGHQYEVDQLAIDANYFETMGLKLDHGRAFKERYENDKRTVVVSELFVKTAGLEQPIGQVFKMDSVQYEIIGVVSDFHNNSFYYKMRPTIFKVANREDYRYLSMRVKAGSEKQTYTELQTQWTKLFPEIPFQGGYQEDVWGGYYEEIGVHAKVWQVVALITVILASLGLYGLITLNVAGRVKEFSIRKVLGAGVKNLVTVITSQYVLLFAIALIIAAPVSYYLMGLMFETAYEYHKPITYSSVIIAIVILILVLLMTVSTQLRKVVKTNPVNGLKAE